MGSVEEEKVPETDIFISLYFIVYFIYYKKKSTVTCDYFTGK